MAFSNTRRSAATAALVLSLGAGWARGQDPQPPPTPLSGAPLTLDEAIALALAHSPQIDAAAADVAAARGRLASARTYPFNPEIELEGAERSDRGRTFDRGVALSQEIELGGRRGNRTAAAEAAVDSAEARLRHRRLEVVATVTRAYAETLRAESLRLLAAADVELTGDLVTLEERRLEAGAGTLLAANVARAAAGRARGLMHETAAEAIAAAARLAEIVGQPQGWASAPPGTLVLPPTPPTPPTPPAMPAMPAVADLTARALTSRQDLVARRHELEEARRRIALQHAMRLPGLRLGAFARQEEGAEIVGAAVAVPLPLFDRNRGGIAEAEAAAERAAADLAVAELAVRREVATAAARHRSAVAAAGDLDRLVVGSLEESVGLLRRAVEAGKVSATEVLLLRRELFEARRAAAGAAGEVLISRAELELVLGAPLAGEVWP